VWEPFIVGCIVCATFSGLIGWLSLEVVWRWNVASRYRARHTASAAPAA
jgi:uncharacterized protein (DUF2062 family)